MIFMGVNRFIFQVSWNSCFWDAKQTSSQDIRDINNETNFV